MSMCFGAAYNRLFLVFVALFGLSLYAFILSMMSFDLATLPASFSDRSPRRGIAGVFGFTAAFLALAWLGRIAATFAAGAVPTLENTTSMFIQAMDPALIVPLCVLAAVLLLRHSSWGYLLASVAVLKFVTMGLAISLMALNQARVGVAISPVELVVFPVITLVNLALAGALLRSADGGRQASVLAVTPWPRS